MSVVQKMMETYEKTPNREKTINNLEVTITRNDKDHNITNEKWEKTKNGFM